MDQSQNPLSSAAIHCEDENMSELGQAGSHCSSTSRDPVKSLRLRVSDTVDGISETQAIQGAGRSQDTILSKLGIFDQTVDPSSPSFNFKRWSHILLDLRSKLGLPTPPRSGFAFRKLTVYGSGPAVEQQDTVWTLLTSLINFRAWFRPKSSKTILQDLDGAVQ